MTSSIEFYKETMKCKATLPLCPLPTHVHIRLHTLKYIYIHHNNMHFKAVIFETLLALVAAAPATPKADKADKADPVSDHPSEQARFCSGVR
jgi:hypothetical protein